MRYFNLLLLCIVVAISTTNLKAQNNFTVELPKIIIADIPSEIIVKTEQYANADSIPITINNTLFFGKKKTANKFVVPYKFKSKQTLNIGINNNSKTLNINAIPLWLSIIPPLIAIIIALFFKEVFTALFVGLFSGTFILYAYQDISIFSAFFKAIFAIPDTYIVNSLTDSGHIAIIIFSMLIGAMVNLITKNGGMQGVVNKLSKLANTSKSGQFITWLLGILIFFDDYANTLVVGNTMRPVTDKLKISREKLAYIVDSTAAPVVSIAMITTWIGIELSYIESATAQVNISESAYSIFLHSLPTRFYPFFTLFFILLLIVTKKDFGAMLKAERYCQKNGVNQAHTSNKAIAEELENLDADKNAPTRWYNAAIPVLIVIFGTFAGLIYTGWNSTVWNNSALSFGTKLSHIIGASDSYQALLWSSISATLATIALTIGQRILSLKDTIDALVSGFKTMLTAILILVLAWSLAAITKDMHTADFISHILISTNVAPELLPTFTFILAAIIAFATGSSWGTMAILYPLILPASWALCHTAGFSDMDSMNIFYITVSAILAGSVLGDHCSPISDTTILSSLASSCNHIEHVRTQLPYALTVGGVSIAIGLLPAAYGVSSWITIPLGFVVLYAIVRFFGKKVTS